MNNALDGYASLLAERDRLRTALEVLVQWVDNDMGGPCEFQEISQARAALAKHDQPICGPYGFTYPTADNK